METSEESYCEILSGVKCWYKNGTATSHRENGPAYDFNNGHQEWWIDGQIHREDGPAVIYADGVEEWWYRDQRIMVSNLKDFQVYIRNKAFW
jgi:hypothetical protein